MESAAPEHILVFVLSVYVAFTRRRLLNSELHNIILIQLSPVVETVWPGNKETQAKNVSQKFHQEPERFIRFEETPLGICPISIFRGTLFEMKSITACS